LANTTRDYATAADGTAAIDARVRARNSSNQERRSVMSSLQRSRKVEGPAMWRDCTVPPSE